MTVNEKRLPPPPRQVENAAIPQTALVAPDILVSRGMNTKMKMLKLFNYLCCLIVKFCLLTHLLVFFPKEVDGSDKNIKAMCPRRLELQYSLPEGGKL